MYLLSIHPTPPRLKTDVTGRSHVTCNYCSLDLMSAWYVCNMVDFME